MTLELIITITLAALSICGTIATTGMWLGRKMERFEARFASGDLRMKHHSDRIDKVAKVTDAQDKRLDGHDLDIDRLKRPHSKPGMERQR